MTTKIDRTLSAIHQLFTRYIANSGTSSQFIACVTPSAHGDDKELNKQPIPKAWLTVRDGYVELCKLSAERDIWKQRAEAAELELKEVYTAYDKLNST